MSEFGGLWKHENNQHALVPPKTECGCPSAGGIKNGHIRYPSYGGTQGKTIWNDDDEDAADYAVNGFESLAPVKRFLQICIQISEQRVLT